MLFRPSMGPEKDLRDTSKGQKRVADVDEIVGHLNAVADKLRRRRMTLRSRPGISFSVNTTQAKRDPLELSVRVHGVDCGVVVFGDAGRMFSPSTNFKQQWIASRKITEPAVLEWGNLGVARFIAACRREADLRKYARRESSIQDSLFRAMEGGGRKKVVLRGFQPVLFGGVPIQIPLPVTPRGSKEHGKHKGHTDILARTLPHGQLVVFEVKRPGASRAECVDALEQAVKYAAALDYLMTRDGHRASYWRLFGSRRGEAHVPSFSAVALLRVGDPKLEKAVQDQLDELVTGSSRYGLSVMFYREVGNGIEIARVLGGPSMPDQGRLAGGRQANAGPKAETRHVERSAHGGNRTTSTESLGRETILEVGAEGGSLSVVRARAHDGAWRFTVLRDETSLADLLDSNDHHGLSFSDESGSVDTLAAALQLMDRYPWHRLLPLTLHEEYAAAVMAEVLRRGGTREVARWKSELSR